MPSQAPTTPVVTEDAPPKSRLLDEDFVNEAHMQAFARALAAPDLSLDSALPSPMVEKASATSSPQQHPPPSVHRPDLDPAQRHVERLSSASDFAPIHSKVKRRSKSKASRKEGWSYHIARYPLLAILLFVIFGEFSVYVCTRQIVNIFEYLLAWTGHKRVIRLKLRTAQTFEEWKAAALEMDEHLGFDEWKAEDEDGGFDWSLVRKVKRSLASLREANDVRGVIGVLDVCLRPSFAGVERARLYSETFYGSKNLIESYIDEVTLALKLVRESSDISNDEKRVFYKAANKNFGSSALCLSGGASFGYYHIGVVKAFLDAGLLPRVMTGTSAGALVCALITTRRDDELRELLVPELADRITACEDGMKVWLKRVWKTGARFDTVDWARKSSFFTYGSLTFREAYERTGRVLNVSVIPNDRHSPTKLLNYLTAPDCVIWSAILASAAVPGILNPVVLMIKTKSGDIVPWSWGTRFKDGSLRVDIPLQSLHLLFNTSFAIVSQVNPHVHLFFFAPKGTAGRPVAHRKGKGWRGGFLLAAMEQYLKLELSKNFRVIRDLELMPTMLGQDWSSVFLQRFDGSVTIWPRSSLRDWFNILQDPDRKELERKIRIGELSTWPKLHMCANRDRIEREILLGRKEVRSAIQRDKPTTDRPVSDVQQRPTSLERTLTSSGAAIPIESDAEDGYARKLAKNALAGPSSSHRRPSTDAALGIGAQGGDRRRGSSLARRRARPAKISSSPQQHENGGRESDGYSSDGAASPQASALSPLQQGFSTLGSSFHRLRTQSFPALWATSPPATSPPTLNGAGRSSASLARSFRKGRVRRGGGGGAGGESSSSEDDEDDDLRDWRRNLTASDEGEGSAYALEEEVAIQDDSDEDDDAEVEDRLLGQEATSTVA